MGLTGYEWTMVSVLVPAMCFASWSDCRSHRVPNWLNVGILLVGAATQGLFRGFGGVSAALLGAAVGFGSLIVFWAMRAMGAGDVKFMSAIGAWLGPTATFHAVLLGGLIGGVFALVKIIQQRSWLQTWMNLGVVMQKVSSTRNAFGDFGSARELGRTSGVIPYAVPLTIGTLCVLVSSFTGWGNFQ